MYKGPLDERYILHNLGVDPVKLAFEMALSVREKKTQKKSHCLLILNSFINDTTLTFSNSTCNCDVRENSLKVITKFCEVIRYWQNKRNKKVSFNLFFKCWK